MIVLRRVGAVIAGLAVAFALVSLAEFFVHRMYPPPPGTNMHDFEQVKHYVATLPLPPLLMVLGGHLLATFAGTFAAAKIASFRV